MEPKFILKRSNQPNLLSSSTLQPKVCLIPQAASWGRRIIMAISGAILIFAPLAYGAVHPWAYFSLGLITTVTSLTLLIFLLYKIFANPHETLIIPYPPLWWLAIGLVIFTAIQVYSWPEGWVALISPQALKIRALGNGYGLADYLPLSLNPQATLLEGLKLWPAVALFFILIYVINSKKQLLGLVGLILAVALFETFYGFLHYRSHLIWGWKNPYFDSGLMGTFINPNNLATLLTMAVLLGYGLFLGLKPTSLRITANLSAWARLRLWSLPQYLEPELRRLLLLLILLILVVGLIFTGSRGGMLSLLFGFSLIALLIKRGGLHKGHLFMIVFFLLSALLFSLIWGSSLPLSRFENIQTERYQVFKGALALFREFPLLGSGIGTFGDLFYQYKWTRMGEDYYYLYTHNDWLQLLAESGITGFALR